MINAQLLQSGLNSKLLTRRIPYSMFVFADGTVTVTCTIQGPTVDVIVPYLVRETGKMKVLCSGSDFSKTVETVDQALSLIVIDIRKALSKFKKYTN